jgi:hypothetical protein
MYRIAPPGDEANVTMFSGCAKSSKSIDIGSVIARAASWNRAALAAYNLAARRWVDVFDERPPAWVIDDTDVEGADAFELRTVTSRNLTPGMSGRPLALTRDGRFAYLSVWRGDEHWSYSIVEIATQRRFVEPPELTGDPPVVAIGPLMLKASNALHYTPSPGWRVVGAARQRGRRRAVVVPVPRHVAHGVVAEWRAARGNLGRRARHRRHQRSRSERRVTRADRLSDSDRLAISDRRTDPHRLAIKSADRS